MQVIRTDNQLIFIHQLFIVEYFKYLMVYMNNVVIVHQLHQDMNLNAGHLCLTEEKL